MTQLPSRRRAAITPASTPLRAFLWAVAAVAFVVLFAPPSAAQGTWTLRIEIELPFRDVNNDGENDYDPQFELRVTRLRGNCDDMTLSPRIANNDSEFQAIASASGFSSSCEMVTLFPTTIASGVQQVNLRRVGLSGHDATINRNTVRVEYTDGHTPFHPNITLRGFAPQHSGTTFEIPFRPTGGPLPGACRLHPDFDHQTWRVNDEGRAELETQVTLLDTEARGGRCQYGLSWPNVSGYIRPSSNALNITASSRSASGTYRLRSERTVFTPAPQLVVPFTDYDDNGAHDYVDRSIVLTYRRAAGEPSGCSNNEQATYTILGSSAPAAHYRLSDTHTVQLPRRATFRISPTNLQLTDSPEHSSHNCLYDITFSNSDEAAGTPPTSQLARAMNPQGDDSRVWSEDIRALAWYENVGTEVDVTLELTTSTDANGQSFDVTVAPVANSHENCSAAEMPMLTIGTDGRAEASLTLADWPAGHESVDDRCTYDVRWPVAETAPSGWDEDATYTAKASTLSAAVRTATNRYRSVFDGEIEVRTTVAVERDTEFSVPLDASPAGCSAPGPAVVTVEAGSTSALAALPRLRAHAEDPAMSCSYAIRWPANENRAAPHAWREDGAHASSTITALDATNRRAVRQYRPTDDTTFELGVSVAVPPLDGTTSGVNLFAGTAFSLTISRSPLSDAGCSASTPISFDYTVQPGGEVTGSPPTPLIDSPGGTGASCAYVFAAQDPKSSEQDAPLNWELRVESATSSVDGASPNAQVSYTVGDITFTPEVNIAVPRISRRPEGATDGELTNLFSDTPLTFDVTFTPADNAPQGCSTPASPTTYAVQPNGLVTGAPPALADRTLALVEQSPQEFVQVGTACSYVATFGARSAGEPWLSRSTETTTLSATSPAGATYVLTDVASPVDVTVTTPPSLDARAVSVSVAVASGASARCSVDDLTSQAGAGSGGASTSGASPAGASTGATSATKQLTLDVFDGTTGVTSLARQFVVTDLPSDAATVADRCRYEVEWSVTDLPTTDAIWTLGARDTTLAPAGRLGSTSQLSAAYRVPTRETFAATLNLVVVAQVPAATTFDVAITPTAGSPDGCSTPPSRTFSAPPTSGGDDRTITETLTLLHTPAGAVGHCAYAVGWPASETGGSAFAADSAFTPGAELSLGRPAATNRYSDADVATNFDATLRVSTTATVAAATTFAVNVDADTGAGEPDGCSADGERLVTIAAGGQSAMTEFSLVRRPARATAECSYTVRWPEHETNGTAWVDDDTFTAKLVLNAASATAANHYAPNVSYFEPSVTIVVPWLDFDADDTHDYEGAQFSVEFSSSDSSCSAVTMAYELNAADDVVPAAAFRLIGAHATSTCEYTLTFSPTSSVTAAGALVKVVADGDDDTLRADANDAQATYAEVVSRFDARLYLGGTPTLVDGQQTNPIPAGTAFAVTIRPQGDAPANCDADPATDETSQMVTITTSAGENQLTHVVVQGLVAHTADGEACVYDVVWPANEVDGTSFELDDAEGRPFSDTVRDGTADDIGAVAWYRVRPEPPADTPPADTPPADTPPADTPPADTPPADTPPADTPPADTPAPGTGGTAARRTGARSAGGSAGRGSAGSTGGASPGPWVVSASSRVPVSVSLAMPDHSFAVGAVVEVLFNVVGVCGDDLETFAGLSASIGVVYALSAQGSVVSDVIADDQLRVARYAERGDQRRDCEVRLTLLSAPAGCTLEAASPEAALTDSAGRPYVRISPDVSPADERADDEQAAFAHVAALACAETLE